LKWQIGYIYWKKRLYGGLFFQHLYSIDHFEEGSGPKWPLGEVYRPFQVDKFFEMADRIHLLGKGVLMEDYFSNICILLTILKREAVQNGL